MLGGGISLDLSLQNHHLGLYALELRDSSLESRNVFLRLGSRPARWGISWAECSKMMKVDLVQIEVDVIKPPLWGCGWSVEGGRRLRGGQLLNHLQPESH